MTKSISANLKSHMAGEVTTLAMCWKLTRKDSTVYAFTNHDQNLTVSGTEYEASSGFLPSAMDHSRALNVDNLDVVALLESAKVTEADIVAGLYDHATVDIFVVNYNSIADGVMYLAKGWTLGEIQIKDNQFVAEIRGLTQHLQNNIVDLFGPGCRADLGDTECGVDVAGSYTVTGTVTAVTNRQVFTDSARGESTDFFAGGKLTWTSGNNNGYSMEVKTFNISTEAITLFLPMPYTIQVGDGYSMTYGCDKSRATCRDRFSNLVNFRGEPDLPGIDGLFQRSASALERQT